MRVALDVESLPAGAQLSRAGVSLGACPQTLQVGVEPLELTVSMSGFRTQVLRLDLAAADSAPTRIVELAPEFRWRHTALGPYTQRPTVGRGRVVACATDQRVRALDLSGQEQWTRRLEPGEQPLGPPALGPNEVVLATDERLLVLELDDGKERWTLPNPLGEVQLLGVFDGALVLLRGKSVRLVSARTREVLWESTSPELPWLGGSCVGAMLCFTPGAER